MTATVKELKGEAFVKFRLAMNSFHLELWVLELEKHTPPTVRYVARIIRERHEQLMEEHGLGL